MRILRPRKTVSWHQASGQLGFGHRPVFIPLHPTASSLRKSQKHPEAGVSGDTCTYHLPGSRCSIQGHPSGDWSEENPEHSSLDQTTFQTKEEGWPFLRSFWRRHCITGTWPKRDPQAGRSSWVTEHLLLHYLLMLIHFQMRKPRPREKVTYPKPLG